MSCFRSVYNYFKILTRLTSESRIPGGARLAHDAMSQRQVRSAPDEPDQAAEHGGIPMRGVQRGAGFPDSRPDAERHRGR